MRDWLTVSRNSYVHIVQTSTLTSHIGVKRTENRARCNLGCFFVWINGHSVFLFHGSHRLGLWGAGLCRVDREQSTPGGFTNIGSCKSLFLCTVIFCIHNTLSLSSRYYLRYTQSVLKSPWVMPFCPNKQFWCTGSLRFAVITNPWWRSGPPFHSTCRSF